MRYLLLLLLPAVFVVQACTVAPASRFNDAGQVESLIDLSSEVVNFAIADERSIDELAQWIQQDQPSMAELYCPANNML